MITAPGSLCAAAQVRAVQITLGITPVQLLLIERIFASLLTCGSNLELASVNSRKVVSGERFVFQCLFSAQCHHDLDRTTGVT